MLTRHTSDHARSAGPAGGRRAAAGATAVVVVAALAGCSASAEADDSGDFFDTSTVHSIDVEVDDGDYQELLDSYTDNGDKEWISGTVTIDGEKYEDVGLRLKGNSTLRGLSSDGGGDAGQGGQDGTTQDDAATGTTTGSAENAADDTTDDTTDDSSADATDDQDGQTGQDGTTDGQDGQQRQMPGGGAGGGMGGDVDADDPTTLPWLIRLDKYVDGQEHDGRADFVVRTSNTETSLNEAVALKVLELADVPAEQATYSRFSVNGGDEELRLVLDLPDDDLWNEDNYSGKGITYKADAEGDWSYRGDDLSVYAEAFEAKYDSTGGSDTAAYAPLEKFLDFVNNSTDEEFTEKLGDYLDVDSFARYLAVQDELVSNSDDIDGPGNNAYLHYDADSGLMEVVAWDQNLSYGGMGGGMGGGQGGGGFGGRGQGGERPDGDAPEGAPEGMEPPTSGQLPQGGPQADGQDDGQDDGQGDGMAGGMGFGNKENALVTRFKADDTFSAAYDKAVDSLTSSIYTSGDAQDYLDDLTSMLTDEASDLVDEDTIASESDSIADQLTGDGASSSGGSGDQGSTSDSPSDASSDGATPSDT